MTWLALRLMRPYLVTAAAVAGAATAYLWHAAGVVQRQLDAAGVPGCHDPNVCYPHGSALNAVFGMELVAAFVPPALGLLLGVALFARERADDTVAFVLVQAISRSRWVFVKAGWTLAAAVTCSGLVALTHRLLATRYTVLANDTYELLQLLHLNNAAYMVAQAVVLTALGGLLGMSTGSTTRTLALSVAAGPVVWLAAGAVGVLLLVPLHGLVTAPDGDLFLMDPLAYLTGAAAGAMAVGLTLLTPRAGTRD